MDDGATKHGGDLYFCVKVPKSISPDGDIYIYADRLDVVAGTLFAFRADTSYPHFIMAPGKWIAVYAASVMDGHAVSVEHWRGEVVR